MIGLAALRLPVQTARWSAAPGAVLAALLVVALAATASRIGMVELAALALLALGWARASGRGRGRVVLGAAVVAHALAPQAGGDANGDLGSGVGRFHASSVAERRISFNSGKG